MSGASRFSNDDRFAVGVLRHKIDVERAGGLFPLGANEPEPELVIENVDVVP